MRPPVLLRFMSEDRRLACLFALERAAVGRRWIREWGEHYRLPIATAQFLSNEHVALCLVAT
jgi:hypothetical protein